MKTELSFRRKTKRNLFHRFYAKGEGANPDYLCQTTNGIYMFGLKRTKFPDGEFDKDIKIGWNDLPQEVKDFITNNIH